MGWGVWVWVSGVQGWTFWGVRCVVCVQDWEGCCITRDEASYIHAVARFTRFCVLVHVVLLLLPLSRDTRRSKGIAYIKYLLPEDAVAAFR